jgi:DNA polymerase III subunit delta'
MTDFVPIERETLPDEADRLDGFPHPRETLWLAGHVEAEQTLLQLFKAGRMPQGVILAGPEGIGKATLAYRLARFILANPDPTAEAVQKANSLHVAADHPVTGQVARLAHGDLGVVRRTAAKAGQTIRTLITAEDARSALDLFRVTASAGGWRIIIVDAADEMNSQAANALLKMLEEPPARAIFLLIAHRAGSMLPTIRSRCRTLRLGGLSNDDLSEALTRLGVEHSPDRLLAVQSAEGSLRRALLLSDPDMISVITSLEQLVMHPAHANPSRWISFAETLTGKAATIRFQFAIEMIEAQLHQAARQISSDPHTKLKVAACMDLWEKLHVSMRETETYSLDRRPLLLMALGALADIRRTLPASS